MSDPSADLLVSRTVSVDVLSSLARDEDDQGMLARALATRDAPVCELRLERGERVGRGWVGPDATLLVTPAGGQVTVTAVATALLPDVLARMNDLGPRPRIAPAVKVPLTPGQLATALARRSLGALAAELGADRAAAADATLRSLREHWLVAARWTPSATSAGARVVEIVDSDAGMWVVVPDGPTVELWPTTPTHVFRMLAGLLPREHELP